MGKSVYKYYKLRRNIPQNKEYDKNLLILFVLLLIGALYLLPECLSLRKQYNELENAASVYQEEKNELNTISPEKAKKNQCYHYIETINSILIDRFQHKLTKVNIQEDSAQLTFDSIDYDELYTLINDLEDIKELKVSSIDISSSSSITTLNLNKI